MAITLCWKPITISVGWALAYSMHIVWGNNLAVPCFGVILKCCAWCRDIISVKSYQDYGMENHFWLIPHFEC